MRRIKIMVVLAVMAIVAAACASSEDTTTTAAATTSEATTTEATTTSEATTESTEATAEDPLAMYGESTNADQALIDKALGPIDPSSVDEQSWNIIKAAVARVNETPDEATIAKAMECWNSQECDTGTGGDIVMGYADGGGDQVNVWRAVSHMEAILQALTYDQIGTIVSTEANFGGATSDPTIAQNDMQFLINRGVDFIVGYPDIGAGLAPQVLAAEAAGIPYVPFSAGYVGLPGQEGALTPGVDYTTVVGEDLCALGDSFAKVLEDGVGEGKVAILGGTPNNALSLGWQQCAIKSLDAAPGITVVNPPPDENTTTGDTSWYDPIIPDVYKGLLTQDPDIKGYAYEYADGQNIGMQVYDELGIPIKDLTVALRTDEQSLFCNWADLNEPTYNIFYSAGGNFQSRVGVTAAMIALQDKSAIPATVTVPHVMRQVTAADCDPNRAATSVSGTSLVPDDILAMMFQS